MEKATVRKDGSIAVMESVFQAFGIVIVKTIVEITQMKLDAKVIHPSLQWPVLQGTGPVQTRIFVSLTSGSVMGTKIVPVVVMSPTAQCCQSVLDFDA